MAEALASVRLHLAQGWVVWVTTQGTMWARMTKGWKGAPKVEREPMTEEEESVVDSVLKEQRP